MPNLDALEPDSPPPFDAEVYRARVREALSGYQPTARHNLDAERHAAREKRRAEGKTEPVDLLRKTMKHLESEGYVTERVEWFDAALKRRHDLFGCIDALAMGNGQLIAVQATSWSNLSSRITKMKESKRLAAWLAAGGKAVCYGWKQDESGRWIYRDAWL